jgi:hypothetical protein
MVLKKKRFNKKNKKFHNKFWPPTSRSPWGFKISLRVKR